MKRSVENFAKRRLKMQELKKNKILTIPNILTIIRLCLIPVFVWLYCARDEYLITAIILILSGVTDVVDGFIARRFNAVSDLGKILDPIADKLTQGAMLICLCTRFDYMIAVIVAMAAKEITLGIITLILINKTQKVQSSRWHGKAATVILYTTLIIHVLWINIPTEISNIVILLCLIAITLSFILYGLSDVKQLLKEEKKEAQI